MLKKLGVRGFKSLRDVSPTELAPLVVLFGPNATGKSNFLEAILLLSRCVTEQTLAEAFKPPIRGFPMEAFELPSNGIQGLLEGPPVSLGLEADVHADSGGGSREQNLKYRLVLGLTPQNGEIRVEDEYLGRLSKAGHLMTSQQARIERNGGELEVRRLGEPGRPHKEPLRLNHTIVSNRQYSGERKYPDFDLLRSEMAGWRGYYLDPKGAMREARPPREVDDIGPRGEDLAPFLYRLKTSTEHHKRFQAVRRALRQIVRSVSDLDVELDKKRGTLDIVVHQDGSSYSSRVISEGTLRVIALCAMAANPWPSSLVSFEEPENGVHPNRIEAIAKLLVSASELRQVIVTTHSPTLVGTMIREQSEAPEGIKLLLCTRSDGVTKIREFTADNELFANHEVREALSSQDDQVVISALLRQGWLDG